MKPLAPCGTNAAYHRHLRWGQQPCVPCSAAHAEVNATYRERKPRQLVPCGSDSSYRRHLRLREVPCLMCVAAHAEAVRSWAQRRREAA